MKQVNLRICRTILPLLLGLFLSVGVYAQNITVKGHVKDALGGVIGANVIEKGNPSNGTITDVDGNFTLSVPKGAILQVSFIGYKTQEIEATSSVIVTLKDDSELLNEVVVIGYGVAKKNDLTGSVTAIKPDEKNKGLVVSAQDMIQGKIAGVNVNTTSGAPGEGAQIRIRGGASLNASNNPLIVIDGMPMDNNNTKGVNNPLSLVNPNDIETFTVLKDASATAIYGSRGSNGVIIITTKKGRKNQAPKVSYNGTLSVSTIADKLDVMNAPEYVEFIKNTYGEGSAAYAGLGWQKYNEDGTPDFSAGTYNTDWQDEIYRAGISHDHNVSVTGGVGNESWSMPYRVSVGYTNQEGILKGSDYNRFTAGFTLNPSLLNDHLNFNINAKYSYSKTNPGGTDAIGAAISMDPTRPIMSEDEQFKNWGGYWQWTKNTSEYDPTFPFARNDDAPKNPVELIEHYTFDKSATVLLGNFEADYKIHGFEDLRLHMNLSGEYADGTPKAGTINSSSTKNWRGQIYLVSWYGRVNYSLLDRYLFTFTARYDGSSRFADGQRWGFFPSAAFAWRVKDEAFLKDVDAVSDLKLRLGWGKTGQQDTGKEYYTVIYKVSTSENHRYPVGPNNPGTLYQPLPYNDDLTWETTTTWNLGLDYGMFDQRLTLNLDAYYRETTDLLSTPTIPAGQNFDNALMLNAGSLKNTGVEIALSGKPVQTKDWFVELGMNIAYNKNEITGLYGGRDVIEAGMKVGTDQQITYHKVGLPANSFWVYQQVYDESGRPIMGCYVDRNADGSIDENDRYYYKNIIAPWTGGFNFKVAYKNWDLGTNFRASFGNYVYNGIESGKANSAMLYNSKGYYENSTADIVSLGWSSYNYALTDYFVQNASFLKCDNITLGYNFDNLFKAGKYKGVSGRIYASCSNVFTITKYKGLDPEQTSGKESSLYPRSRTFLLGLNLNF
ncbi:SusC/RagA family TonB-linked outer membrane protein [Bacteroides stercoris]|uniref:TonB-linked outer membrane protein, SusC/RagA family n=1 Tax=Bacteroides stercoris ATCC 43183 TaxID=449673 RepID=B0NQK8_BACSE|nr:TonB-dependent receptor [Bacteroides stercoris]EDS15157.1 TonB-linked outer membrane protein, SusC/RagA family [Bacteroides stercoris ATCC 43183]SDX13148.1 TonB-linked outer membrane protein, SusC/RagA family [Bacteroides stercoris]